MVIKISPGIYAYFFILCFIALDLQIYLYCIVMLLHSAEVSYDTGTPFSPCLDPKLAILPSVFPSDTRSVILSEHLRPWYIILSQNHFCLFRKKIK